MTNSNWRILCDHETGLKITEFCPKKDKMAEPTLAKFDRFRKTGINVTHVRMDDAWENKKLKK